MIGRTNAGSGMKELQYASGSKSVNYGGKITISGLAFQPIACTGYINQNGSPIGLLASGDGTVLWAHSDTEDVTDGSSVADGKIIIGATEDGATGNTYTFKYHIIGY